MNIACAKTVPEYKPKYQPKTITIVVEFEDEEKALRALFARDVSVPDYLVRNWRLSESHQRILCNVLGRLFDALVH